MLLFLSAGELPEKTRGVDFLPGTDMAEIGAEIVVSRTKNLLLPFFLPSFVVSSHTVSNARKALGATCQRKSGTEAPAHPKPWQKQGSAKRPKCVAQLENGQTYFGQEWHLFFSLGFATVVGCISTGERLQVALSRNHFRVDKYGTYSS